jgi:hypothetical protein
VGFAAWTDEVTIDGTVNTGNVDLVVEAYSGSLVWKMENHGIFTQSGWLPLGAPPAGAVDAFPNDGEADLDPVSSGMASQSVNAAGEPIDDAVTMKFENLFPLVPVKADFLLHYAGSIPVRVNIVDIAVGGPPELVQNATITIEYFDADADGVYNPDEPMGDIALMQLHYCDYIVVVITITLDQTPDNMGIDNGTITGRIQVKQWNEVPSP